MKICCALLFVLLLASVVSAGDPVQEITAMLHEQDAAWSRGDLDGFMKCYEDSGELVFMTSDGPVRSYQTLKERYEKRYKTGANDFGKLTFSDLQVEVLADGIARAYGKWIVDTKDTDGKPKQLSGWFSLILKNTPKGWKIIHDHSS